MSRLFITLSRDGEKIPFLRGVLTRSLQNAGLNFDQALELATSIRDGIKQENEISVDHLRERVIHELKKIGPDFAKRYLGVRAGRTPIIHLKDGSGHMVPFSRGELRGRLESCDISTEQATGIASRIHDHLLASGNSCYDTAYVKNLILNTIEKQVGQVHARNYLVWEHFFESGKPLILLIGGAACTGKSTISTEIGHRLQIGRYQSTDLLREVMRSMIPNTLLPSLHESSFLAWKGLPKLVQTQGSHESVMLNGFVTQAELMMHSCQAAIRRALKEQVSLILEGVHILPGFHVDIPEDSDPVIISLTVGVLSRKKLKKRIWGREKATPTRRAQRYLENFESIWDQQSFLLAEADRLGVPIISNMDKDEAVIEAMKYILSSISDHFEKRGVRIGEPGQSPSWSQKPVVTSPPETESPEEVES